MAIFFVTYLGFAVTRHVAFIGALFALYGFYQGIFRSVGKALASDYVPTRSMPARLAVQHDDWRVRLMASLLAGWLWDHMGHASVFLVGRVAVWAPSHYSC